MLPTVKIADGAGGFYIINESDFDPTRHTLYGAVASAAAPISATDLLAKSIKELKAIASELAIPGRSRMNEQQLAQAISEAGYDPNKLSD